MQALDTGYSQTDPLVIPKIFFSGSCVSFFPDALTLVPQIGILLPPL